MVTVTPDEVRALAAASETFTVEFKRGQGLNDTIIVSAAVCLANGRGGKLLLGVENDGAITGIAPRHGDRTDPARLRAMILNKTEPALATVVEVVDIDGVDVAVVHIQPASTPVGTKDGLFVRRSTKSDGTPECVPYRAHEIISVGLSAQGRDYAETVLSDIDIDDLDPQEFDRFRELCATGRGDTSLADASDEDILRALRLQVPRTAALALGAVLMFGKPQSLARIVPTAEVIIQEERSGKLVFDEGIRAPLLRTAERLSEIMEARNSEQELQVGLHRVRVPRLPEMTVREVIANALVHRDYSESGPVSVRLTEDALRISSPGGFPPGITAENIFEDSRPRSVILADAFKRAGLVDRAGRGVPRIYDNLLRLGRDGPDFSGTNDHAVVVSIPTSDADLEMVRFIIDYEESTGTQLMLRELRVLHSLKVAGPAELGELARSLAISEAGVRTSTTRLTEAGLVEARGSGRGRRYHLAPSFYRSAAPEAYVRMRDFDPIQQDQMVLSYLDTYGSITRSKAAALCRLTPPEAARLLKRLVQAGELELRGEKRGSHYVRVRRGDAR